MRLRSPWTPRLADVEGGTAERLVQALSDDITAGRLSGGDRLPAHRDLAWRLGIGLGTVTKAYATVERRGLTRSVKGRGTFVAIHEAHAQRPVDLSLNTPPAILARRRLAHTLAAVAGRIDADQINLYAPPAGHVEHRRLLARWLETLGIAADASRLVLTSNASQAMALAFDLACGPGGVILTERLTWPGAIAIARHGGFRMRGIAIDGQGMVPEALAAALAADPGGRKAVYLTPTLHNPTTATMGPARRRAIVELCRRAGALVVEDGVYTFARPTLPDLATLAPDITLHVNGLSKSLGPGLRIGVLAVPPPLVEAAEDLVRTLPMEPSPLACAVVGEWLASGVISAVLDDLFHEMDRRARLAASHLGAAGLVTDPAACHAWLPMPRDTALDLVSAAAARGLRLTPAQSVMVDGGDAVGGVRLCLGGPSFDELGRALETLSEMLAPPPGLHPTGDGERRGRRLP